MFSFCLDKSRQTTIFKKCTTTFSLQDMFRSFQRSSSVWDRLQLKLNFLHFFFHFDKYELYAAKLYTESIETSLSHKIRLSNSVQVVTLHQVPVSFFSGLDPCSV